MLLKDKKENTKQNQKLAASTALTRKNPSKFLSELKFKW